MIGERLRKVQRGGSHRVKAAADTLRVLEPHLSSMGITRVANITGLDDIGIPVTLVVRPNARSLSVSQGKGVTLEAAKASGIMESIEQYCAERVDHAVKLASYNDLLGRHPVVDVAALPRYVQPFDPDQSTLWIEATELRSGRSLLVPFGMVHLNLTEPLPPGSYMFPVGSNGLASGNTLEEATAHGLWELVERDAEALFYALPPEEQWQRRLDLQTVESEDCQQLLRKFRRAGVRVAIWSLTTDTSIAAFLCGIVEDSFNPFRPVGCAYGRGCHVDRDIALCRALTEAAQSRLTRLAGSRDDIENLDAMTDESSIRAAQARFVEAVQLPLRFTGVPSKKLETFEEDLDWTMRCLELAGLPSPLRVDLSPSGLPVSVVRVLAPGLEGAPGVPGYVAGPRANSPRRV